MKQFNLPFIGAFKDTLSASMMWVGVINFMLNIPTAYQIWLKGFWPGLSLWMFIIFIIAAIALLMILEYTFIMRSWYSFARKQDGTKVMLQAICRKLDIKEVNY